MKLQSLSDIDTLVQSLELLPHPEGGFYKETYRSAEILAVSSRFEDGKRAASTAIYYLLRGEDFSAWHKIKSDEIWHLYKGSSVTIYTIDPKTQALSALVLGGEHHQYQVTVPRGYWFCAKVNDPKSYALCGCTVAPGFDFRDFELADRKQLIKEFPQHKAMIEKFTR